MGDIVHGLGALGALRCSLPDSRIDWVVERRWGPLLEGCGDLNEVILLDRSPASEVVRCIRTLRAAQYDYAVDFQGLYKSALLALACGAPRRVGFARSHAREPLAAVFYTQKVVPQGLHVADQNRSLVQAAGADGKVHRFSALRVEESPATLAARLELGFPRQYFVVSPGGGWKSKLWPPERYGELCRLLIARTGWKAVANCSRGEEALGEGVRRAAAPAYVKTASLDVSLLKTLLAGAAIVIAGDSGPLHLAAALGTPVVGLYGPTDPARNGPYCQEEFVVRNAKPEETSYRRGTSYSGAMLSISVGQALEAVERRLSFAR